MTRAMRPRRPVPNVFPNARQSTKVFHITKDEWQKLRRLNAAARRLVFGQVAVEVIGEPTIHRCQLQDKRTRSRKVQQRRPSKMAGPSITQHQCNGVLNRCIEPYPKSHRSSFNIHRHSDTASRRLFTRVRNEDTARMPPRIFNLVVRDLPSGRATTPAP